MMTGGLHAALLQHCSAARRATETYRRSPSLHIRVTRKLKSETYLYKNSDLPRMKIKILAVFLLLFGSPVLLPKGCSFAACLLFFDAFWLRSLEKQQSLPTP